MLDILPFVNTPHPPFKLHPSPSSSPSPSLPPFPQPNLPRLRRLQLRAVDVRCFRPEEDLVQSDRNGDGAARPKVFPYWAKKSKSYIQRVLSRRIVVLTKRRQLNAVFEVVEKAKRKDVIPNRIVMNAVMAACVHCGDVDRAFGVYQDMLKPEGCGVDNITYGILLKGLGEARRLDEAFEMVESLEKGKLPGSPTLTEVHVRTLLNSFADAGDMLRARGVLTRYRALVNRMGPSIFTYNVLIKGYAKSDRPLEALKLKDDILRLGLQPNRLTFNSFILACIRGRDLPKALELLMEMKKEGERLESLDLLPDIVTYTTLIKGFGEHGDLDGIRSLVEELKVSSTCALDNVAYGVIIDAYLAAGSPTEGLFFFQEMVESAKQNPKLKPKAHVFLSLMRFYAAKGEVDMVKMLHKRIVPETAGNVTPKNRVEADELLIEAAINDNQLDFARELLRNMVALKKGLSLSNRALLAIVRLQAISNFHDGLFSPYVLQVSLEDPVEEFMLTYEAVRPVSCDLRLSNVIMRFFKDVALPVVDKWGNCVGVVHEADCIEVDAPLFDIMKGPPPTVTTSTPLFKALSLLLESQVELVVVLNINAEVVGFLTRERILNFRHDSNTSEPKVKTNWLIQDQ